MCCFLKCTLGQNINASIVPLYSLWKPIWTKQKLLSCKISQNFLQQELQSKINFLSKVKNIFQLRNWPKMRAFSRLAITKKIAPWSSRWFEEISLALIWLALIWLALIWLALICLALIWLTLICLALIWLTLIWLALIWLAFFVKILTFFT